MVNLNNLKELKNYIEQNHGATLTPTLDNATHNNGFYVSLKDFETKTRLSRLDIRTIKHYQEKAQKYGAYIGAWIDNGVLYLDISKHVKSKRKALKLARKNYQLAIYDIKKGKSVYIHWKNHKLY